MLLDSSILVTCVKAFLSRNVPETLVSKRMKNLITGVMCHVHQIEEYLLHCIYIRSSRLLRC